MLKLRGYRSFAVVLMILGSLAVVSGQSRTAESPTPVTGPEISGKIPARDVGDSRLTAFYYVFAANPGDIMLDVSVSNFTGDIDVFTADQLRPKTKVTIIPGMDSWETSRIIYSRQRERLILRIEGRTPNDDAASYRIRLGGSFEPLQEAAVAADPTVKAKSTSDVQVNSVGTIISEKKPEGKKSAAMTPPDKKTSAPSKTPLSKPQATKSSSRTPSKEKVSDVKRNSSDASSAGMNKTIGPLLVVQFKEGENFVRPMAEVTSVTVSSGVVALKTIDGKTRIFSLSDVARMAIE